MNADGLTRPDEPVRCRPQVADDVEAVPPDLYDYVDCRDVEDGPYHVDGRYFADATDAAIMRARAAEQARRDAERAARYAARQAERAADRAAEAAAAAPAINPKRLEAALRLRVRPVGPRQYRVESGREAHYVDLTADAASPLRCDCADKLYRGVHCKHEIRAVVAAGDAIVLDTLATLVAAARTAGRTAA